MRTTKRLVLFVVLGMASIASANGGLLELSINRGAVDTALPGVMYINIYANETLMPGVNNHYYILVSQVSNTWDPSQSWAYGYGVDITWGLDELGIEHPEGEDGLLLGVFPVYETRPAQTLVSARLTTDANTTISIYQMDDNDYTKIDYNVGVVDQIQILPACCNISGRIVGADPPLNTIGIEGVQLGGFPNYNIYTDSNGYYSAVVPPGSFTITPIDPNGQWSYNPPSFNCGSDGDLIQDVTGTALECLNARAPGYTAWKTWNKPACWCNRRQCRGDVGGTKIGFWVYSTDLNTFKSVYGKSDAIAATVPNGICADFDHFKSCCRVYSSDLNILKAYYAKSDASVPECNQPPNSIKVNKWNN